MTQQFLFEQTGIADLKIVSPFFADDERGWFLKSYEKDVFLKNGIATDIFEDFESYSVRGVIRGLHFQTKNPQSKLVRAISGEIFDVAVDLRKGSPTFGQWEGFLLSGENRKSLFIPAGFAHGFMSVSDAAVVSYKCTGKYEKEFDTGIIWNDKTLNIAWPLEQADKIIVSEKDSRLQTFEEFCRKNKNI